MILGPWKSPLHDRSGERGRISSAIGTHPRLLICGPDDAGVSDFSTWFVRKYSTEDYRLLHWDFEQAPGMEGIDILRDLAGQLPNSLRFTEAYESMKAEFAHAPTIHACQVIGERASAGRDQTITTELKTPSFPDHVQRNLNRLARALFEDFKHASEHQRMLLVFSGIQISGDNPTPTRPLLNVIISSMWRLAEHCSPAQLCVVLAVESNVNELSDLGQYFRCILGPVTLDEACEAMIEKIPRFSDKEATAVLHSVVKPGSTGIAYRDLRDRIAILALHRLEPLAGEAVQ